MKVERYAEVVADTYMKKEIKTNDLGFVKIDPAILTTILDGDVEVGDIRDALEKITDERGWDYEYNHHTVTDGAGKPIYHIVEWHVRR